MARIKQQSQRDLSVTLPSSVAAPDRSVATAIQGIGTLAGMAAEQAGKAAAQEDFESQQSALGAFEDTLVDISFRAEQERQGVASDGFELSDDDKQALSEAGVAAQRISALENQAGAADKAKLQRAAAFRQFKAAYPHLAGEMRELFKQQTGQSVVQSLRSVEEDRQQEAQEALAATQARLTTLATNLGYTVTTENIAELEALVAPYSNELVAAQNASRRAQLLKDQKTIRTEQRIKTQESIVQEGFKGTLISNQLHINDLLADFDPATADEETKASLVQELQVAKRAFETSVRDAAPDLDGSELTTRMQPVLDGYDEAMAVVTGEQELSILQNNNKIRTEAAMQNLHRMPGYTDLSLRLQTFRNLPSDLIGGGQASQFSVDMVQPMLTMLATGLRKPTANPYGALEASGSDQQVAGQYRALRDVALAELGNSEASQNLADALQAWTNQFTVAPEEVPLPVLSSMLDVAAEPGSMEVLSKSDQLPENLVSGFRSFTERMRGSLGETLAEEFDTRFKVYAEGQESPGKAGLLNFLTEDYAESSKQPKASPKLFEMVDLEVQANGNIRFKTAVKEAQSNPRITQRVNTLNKAYGLTFGKLARAYAHTVLKNQDYKRAAQELMSSPEWESALVQVEGTGFEGTQTEEGE